jgi:hypothetical protein
LLALALAVVVRHARRLRFGIGVEWRHCCVCLPYS